MNIDRLEYLAKWLEAGAPHERVRFDMSYGILFESVPQTLEEALQPACETFSCLAGAAIQFFQEGDWFKVLFDRTPMLLPGDKGRELQWASIREEAERLLGLDRLTAERLFEPVRWSSRYDEHRHHNDTAWAARTIRHLIATGEANWDATYIRGESK